MRTITASDAAKAVVRRNTEEVKEKEGLTSSKSSSRTTSSITHLSQT